MRVLDPDVDLIPLDYEKRLHRILDTSWRIFQAQFIYDRHIIKTEAPFQLHFANIIATVGGLYCLQRGDLFTVDLETLCQGIRGKNKYLDITCGFVNPDVKCAIELKFKTKEQGGQTDNRVEVYHDLEALEWACAIQYNFGKFYMITNDEAYVKPPGRGSGSSAFWLYTGFQSTPGPYPIPRTRNGSIMVNLKNSYQFKWEPRDGIRRIDGIEKWYFLDLLVPPAQNDEVTF